METVGRSAGGMADRSASTSSVTWLPDSCEQRGRGAHKGLSVEWLEALASPQQRPGHLDRHLGLSSSMAGWPARALLCPIPCSTTELSHTQCGASWLGSARGLPPAPAHGPAGIKMKAYFAEPVEVEAANKANTTPYGRKMADWRHWWRRWHIRCALGAGGGGRWAWQGAARAGGCA